MALVSSSLELWNPKAVLDVYPNSAQSTCVGVRNGTEVRCGWRLVPNDQFSASQLAVAANTLRLMSAKDPAAVTSGEIRAVVQNLLCEHHGWQTSTVGSEWEAKIGEFIRKRSGMLGTRTAVKHSQREEETDKFDLNEVKKALEASQTLCSKLTEKTTKLEKDQAASSRDLVLLKQQMADLQTDAETRNELDTKVDRLKAQTEAKHAILETNAAAGATETQRLRTVNAQLNGMMTTNNLEIASLKAKVRDLDRALDERARRSEDEVRDLRRQIEASGREITVLKEAKASLTEKANASAQEAKSLRQALRESNTRHEELKARSDTSSNRLTNSLQSLSQKHADSHTAITLLQHTTASLEASATARETETETLRQDLHSHTARHAALEARTTDSSTRLDDLAQKHQSAHADHALRISQLVARNDSQHAQISETASRVQTLEQKHTEAAAVQEEQGGRIERLVVESEERERRKGKGVKGLWRRFGGGRREKDE